MDAAVGFFLDTRVNDSFRAVNRLLKAGEEVRRLQEPLVVKKTTYPAGTFFVTRKAATVPLLERIAFEIGTSFTGSATAPEKQAVALKPVRIALWDRYGGSMPSGWTRWILERFEFPFEVVYVPLLDKGKLREKFDVLILVDDALPGRGPRGLPIGENGMEVMLQPPDEPQPAEPSDRRGSITTTTTVPQLKKFMEEGGTIVTIGNSTGLAAMLGLPVSNHLVTKNTEGKDQALSREKFYVPASVLKVKVNGTHPLAWGVGDEADVMFASSPTFKLAEDAEKKGISRIAWFDTKTPLRSGWAYGQEYLNGGTAIIEAKVGKGKLVLCGPQVLFRGQPHGTFKFVFNGIVQSALKE